MSRKTAAVAWWGLGVALAALVGCGEAQDGTGDFTGPEAAEEGTRKAELTTQVVTLTASADVHVSAVSPTTRSGSSQTLEVDLQPESEAYLRFYVGDLPGTITAARLRVYAVDGSANGPTVYDPPGVRSWGEDTTWSTRPDISYSWPVGSAGAVASGTWMEIDISESRIFEYSSHDIYLGADSTDGVTLASSEYPDPALRPQLILTLESAEDHPRPSPEPLVLSGAPLAFPAVADAYVAADGTGGNGPSLLVDGSPQQEAHLRFSVTGLSEGVQRAVLRVYTSAGTDDGPAVYATQGSWSETGLTWGSRPAKVGAALGDAQVLTASTWMDYDVTDLVRGNGEYSLGLYATSSDGVTLHSRESTDASRRPQLIVWTGAPRAAPADACLTRTEFVSNPWTAGHDTYAAVDDPAGKFHATASLRVDGEPRAESFLRFDNVELGAGRVHRVLLRLYSLDATGNGPKLFRAAPFDEATVDWDHRPAVTGGAIGDVGAIGRDTWVEYDVTSVVTASGSHAFALLPDSTDATRFVSWEAEERAIIGGAPRLVVISETDPFCSYRGTKPAGTTAWVRQSGGPEAERSEHLAPAPDGGFVRLASAEAAPGAGYSLEQVDTVSLHRADGSVAWTRSFAQAGVTLQKVVVTPLGNVLVAGSYRGAPDLGRGPLPQGSGLVVMKLTPGGQVDWTRGYTAWFGTGEDRYENPMDALDLATDAHGSVVLVGSFWGYTDFGAGPVYSGKAYPYDDEYPNSFVLKLQWDGAYLWSRVLAASSLRGTRAESVVVDAEENIIVGGWAGPNTDFGAGPISQASAFVARWSASGAYGWARLLPMFWSEVSDVGLLPDGRIAFNGWFGGRFTFAGQQYASSEPDEYEGGPYDGFIGVLTAQGADVALRQFPLHTFGGMAVDATGNIVTYQDRGGGALGLGEVGWGEGYPYWVYRPTLAAFGPGLETRWVRVFDAMEWRPQLTAVPDGLVVSGQFSQAFELDGTWYTPMARRADLLLFKLRP